uniref:AarF domain-containing protein kinase 1 n=1 Tax=Geotrypetes seraphini TaxID=260995 RepID=A0A6P8RTW5_GEOSA|nr:aarF domain-containing protein kinase 1 isoform X7 [Geotrypetes seraphini]
MKGPGHLATGATELKIWSRCSRQTYFLCHLAGEWGQREWHPASPSYDDQHSVSTMARRTLKLTALAAAALATSGFHVYAMKYVDLNDFGVVRIGRAVLTTAAISYDYITSLRSVPYGTQEYDDLKSQIREVFVSFEETPLGAASLAQVHKAVLPDGRTVAVKVQHPKVQTQSSKDIFLMEVLLKVVKYIFPDFEFMWLVEEAKKNLPLELDFLNEGKNCEAVAGMLQNFHFLKVPKIHWELSTKRVLVMEFLEGGQVNDREYMETHGIDVNEISRGLGRLYSEMIFMNGFVHCDPHPGNVLVRKDVAAGTAEIILLDHGLYQLLTEEFRIDYCQLWKSLINADMKGVQHYSRQLGAGDLYPLFACMLTARSWNSVNRGIGKSPVTKAEDVEIRTNAAAYLPQISQLLNNVPRQMLLLLKTNDLLRGIETTLHTRANASSFLIMSRCCVRALARHRRSKARSRFRRTQISFSEALDLGLINVYELFLRMKSSFLWTWILALLSWIPTSPY